MPAESCAGGLPQAGWGIRLREGAATCGARVGMAAATDRRRPSSACRPIRCGQAHIRPVIMTCFHSGAFCIFQSYLTYRVGGEALADVGVACIASTGRMVAGLYRHMGPAQQQHLRSAVHHGSRSLHAAYSSFTLHTAPAWIQELDQGAVRQVITSTTCNFMPPGSLAIAAH